MMNKGKWEVRKLGDLCTIQLGKTPYRKDSKLWDKAKISNNIWLSIADLRHGGRIYDSTEYISDAGADNMTIIPKDTILLSFKLTLGRVSFAGTDLYTNEAIASLLNLNKVISKEFLFYYFTFFDWDKAAEGDIKVKGKTLNKRKLQDLPILFPSITEQQRIVSLLDEAFESIDQAKANAEKNLENAKELFESYLQSVFETKGEGWEEKKFKDVCVLQRGFDLPTREREKGDYPLVSSNGVTDYINQCKVNAPGVVTGRSGTIGRVHYIEDDFWPLNTALYIKDFQGNNERFIYYFLKYFKLERFSSGAGVPTLNRNNVHTEKVIVPTNILEQKRIVEKLDLLKEEINQLESQYQTKLENLEELRKSILEKAFNGEL